MRSKFGARPQVVAAVVAGMTLLGALLSGAGAAPGKKAGAGRAGKALPASTSQKNSRADLERRFTSTVQPFLQTYCASCHGKNDPAAQLDLTAFRNVESATQAYPHLATVVDRLTEQQMPPAGSKQPPAAQRDAVVAWIRALRTYEAERNAGDPGPVLARRLSNSEYDYTIRDLTGFDLRPTREFPVDPANQEGFDNSGESLTISPALARKYLQAARGVADHLVLQSNGIGFASHPMLVETDQDKYSILRIVDFYHRQPTGYAEYFLAAWRFRHRAALGTPQATLATIAADSKLSPRYLELIWNTLNAPEQKVGPVAKLQGMWNALPQPKSADTDGAATKQARENCVAMREFVAALRTKLASKFENLQLPGFSPGGQWNLLWKDRQYAANRRTLNLSALQIGGAAPPILVKRRGRDRNKEPEMKPGIPDPDLFVPEAEAERAPYLESFRQFCNVFPDAFYIAERGRMEFFDPNDKGRLLSAGFHNMMGYFRDDTPLMELVLDDTGRKTLNRLWDDFNVIAKVQERMHLEFIFYERAEAHTITDHEFDFARSEDKDAILDAKIRRLAEVYLAKARKNAGDNPAYAPALRAMEDHFRLTSENIRAVEKIRAASEATHLPALLEFAQRAYRRPLTLAERESLTGFYRTLREKDGVSHEDAARDLVVSVLMSPNFLFRLDMGAPETTAQAGKGQRAEAASGARLAALAAKPGRAGKSAPSKAAPAPFRSLTDYELASRLSYFLWSSLPDQELLSHAAAGDLHRPEVLAAQARRMVRDPKIRGLAVEFGGNWLDYRRFEEHNAVDRERFPSFNDELREAMFEEPIHFLMDLFENNGSMLDLLYGNYTFVNAPLAKHYQMDEVLKANSLSADEWVRVENADRYGRGGLLPMALFLTKNSGGLRTSPVKRGYWLVRRVLGEHIPPPPPTVPELPKDESQLGEKTLRQALEAHRQNPACSGCHARFDSYGLVFEGYGPVGDQRTKDLGGKPVDTRAPFPGGERSGLTGLREFLRAQRQNDFVENLCRKLLAYSLGRTLLPSDDPTVAQMRKRLAGNGNRIGTVVEAIVTSRQFRTRRVVDATLPGGAPIAYRGVSTKVIRMAGR